MESLTLDVAELSPEQVAELLAFARSLALDGPALEERELDDESWRDAELTGWELRHVELLREHLASRGKVVQLGAFDLAIEQGGFVSRASVYRLGEYESSRRLNNWTAPFIVASDWLEDEHGLPSDTLYPVSAVYNEDISGYQRALGFEVLPEIVRLVRESTE